MFLALLLLQESFVFYVLEGGKKTCLLLAWEDQEVHGLNAHCAGGIKGDGYVCPLGDQCRC